MNPKVASPSKSRSWLDAVACKKEELPNLGARSLDVRIRVFVSPPSDSF